MNVLVTGGTGYFGKGFVKKLLANNLAERICIYSRGEFAQHKMREEFNDDSRLRWFIGDVRDQDRLRRAMSGCNLVIHAAALKRVEVCTYNVLECIATNVYGTENVVKAAIDSGVKRAVLLSTDKAMAPTNVYGFSKAIAEHIFLNAASYSRSGGTEFVVTRFGNVANSTGSIIPVWAKRKADGLICEMRDPDVTRFWMTRNEAVAFVFAAATEFEVSRVHIPELPGYRLQDLADAMGVETKLTELLPGEKKHETMDGVTDSSHARRMSVDELREALNEIL